MKTFILTAIAALFFSTGFAGRINGIVRDEQGAPLPYATVTIKGTPNGTTANSKGFYAVALTPGTYTLVFEYVGYITIEKTITATDNDQVLDITLYTNDHLMGEVVVQSKGEDPAYRIIRQAIKKRTYYEQQNDSLSVMIYLKGIIRTLNIPKKVLGQKVERDTNDGLDSAGKGVLLLSESTLQLDEIRPRQSKVTVKSSYERGNNMGLNFSKVTSFYTNNVAVFDINSSSRGYISPIADGALNFYRYKLLNTYTRDGTTVKTIRVIPRRKNEPLFSGIIEIADSSWRIYSLDLLLTKEYQLELIDTLRIKQLHSPVAPDVWKTRNQIVSISFNQFGFRGIGSFVNVYYDYNLHPLYPSGYFNNIVMKYDTGYYKRDSNFWKQERPVTLEDDEKRYYAFRDSISALNKNRPKSYYDSLRRHQKISVFNILWNNQQYRWYSKNHTLSYKLRGLLKGLEYNTVEGVALKVDQTLNYTPIKGNYLYDLRWNLRYGFENHHFNSYGTLTIKPRQLPYRNRYLSFSGGKRVSQFNPDEPIDALTNTFYTLFLRSNFMKLYENWFGSIRYNNRFENGLGLNASLLYEDRIPLQNRSDYSFFNRDKRFTSNHPEALQHIPFDPHQALIAGLTITYQLGQRYIQYPNYKASIGSDKPVFSFTYTAGIPQLLGSDVDYHKWAVEMTHEKNLKLAGLFKYRLGAGGFLSAKEYYLPDMKHFNGNQTFYNIKYLNSFQLAPYYAYSNAARFYAEGNIEHHFNGLLTNKIPLFNKLKWNLVAGSNAFYVNKNQYYAEAFVGLENIFKLFRVDVIAGYQPLLKTTYGVRVGLGGLLGSAFRFEK
ncbi:DUF5686 and carboxypeptidase regulatory-like domain-containing protein [Niabella beijingensis]|uniref:DUF5686 and carboxypeptidase regulatory-like domain-containing protein n=1 Tax=Niabella beijingensis TaxID=2872700 RepID=UPI001CBE572E|nr:DUF5686 and carboxypeptidase regulatory-like domain-containing protein [Niabella beijingensis]MBZ4188500.1 DUF5686 and carboxypeptidase regulatory-like domain-containing protein [Niabella beijingensis]